jgi:hypothetical protein
MARHGLIAPAARMAALGGADAERDRGGGQQLVFAMRVQA